MKKGMTKTYYWGILAGEEMYYKEAGILMDGFQMNIYDKDKNFVATVFNERMFYDCIDTLV